LEPVTVLAAPRLDSVSFAEVSFAEVSFAEVSFAAAPVSTRSVFQTGEPAHSSWW
jgi:hypothetical protein